jgi:hypothetical protein
LAKTCGSDQTGTSGSIISPNYPNPYYNSDACSWNINAPAGTFITLNITSLWLESCCDFLFILSPQNCSNAFSKRLTSRISSLVVTVPQNTVSLALRTDGSVTYTGFNITWTAYPSCAAFVNTLYLNYAGLNLQVCARVKFAYLFD